MLLNSRTTRLLIEAAEAAGLARADVLTPLASLGLVEKDVVALDARVAWSTLIRLVERVDELVAGDVEKLREIGRRMNYTLAYAPLRRVVGAVISPRTLHDIAMRTLAPANFPHLRTAGKFEGSGSRRMTLDVEIPPPHVSSVPFFHICEGSVTEVTALLGLPPAVILESHITPRTWHFVIELPPERSIFGQVRRGVRALLAAPGAVDELRRQRIVLAENVEELQRARDELRALLERLPDFVVVHAHGNLIWANRAFTTALGYEIDDIIGKPMLDLVAERSRGAIEERMRLPVDVPFDAGPHSPAADLAEFALLTRTGEEVVVEVAPTQAVVFDGVVARLVVGRDVTERIRMQQKLIVSDRLASVGLLAAGVAHEVNNPLAYVLNNIEIANKELASLGPAADVSRQALAIALEGVDRIRTIVHDLLLLSRGDEGTTTTVDVRAVAESTLALAAREIEHVATLVQEIEPAPLVVDASEARIAQILLNLVANALEAMRARDRERERERERDRLRATNVLTVRIARAVDGRASLQVADTGIGISPADVPRLFEPFFTTKPAGKGTGLGLSIAHRLVVELGGEIIVTSAVGSGTTFTVFLPPTATSASV